MTGKAEVTAVSGDCTQNRVNERNGDVPTVTGRLFQGQPHLPFRMGLQFRRESLNDDQLYDDSDDRRKRQ